MSEYVDSAFLPEGFCGKFASDVPASPMLGMGCVQEA
jgi:hypothetical protein